MKRTIIFTILMVVALSTQPVWALFNDYNYISADEVKEQLNSSAAMTLVDIQVKEEFDRHHIKGAVATYAYPVKSAADISKLAASVPALMNSKDKVVIVCPRGGGGAKRAYDYLLDQGIEGERLAILAKGQDGWSHPELLAAQQ